MNEMRKLMETINKIESGSKEKIQEGVRFTPGTSFYCVMSPSGKYLYNSYGYGDFGDVVGYSTAPKKSGMFTTEEKARAFVPNSIRYLEKQLSKIKSSFQSPADKKWVKTTAAKIEKKKEELEKMAGAVKIIEVSIQEI